MVVGGRARSSGANTTIMAKGQAADHILIIVALVVFFFLVDGRLKDDEFCSIVWFVKGLYSQGD